MESNERVHFNKKSVKTLETGRRSKDLVLHGEEALRRERRREKNREAARRLKEKRQLIEDELNQKIKDLEMQHFGLEKYLQFLQRIKKLLENLINDLTIDKILSNKDYSFDVFDESIESILKDIFV
jgi:hypothetical protein